MGKRQDLQDLLKTLGMTNVYFQPPENLKMVYPCIVYNRSGIESEHAGNKPYRSTSQYLVTVIDKNPDSEIPDRVAALPMSTFVRHFSRDNLNHYIFSLYF